MNPPYRPAIGKWIRKAYESSQRGATVVCLVPARTDTKWWHEYAARGGIHFLRGRLMFVGAKHCAPSPSAIVVFQPPTDLSDHENALTTLQNARPRRTRKPVGETDDTVHHLFGFTGRERDEESDLQYNRARYYDAALGQWLSEDPIGFGASDADLRRYLGNPASSPLVGECFRLVSYVSRHLGHN